MKSQVSLVIASIMLLVLISYHQTSEAAPAAADIQGGPYRVKRSFCNTYGGCSSSKRSIQQQQAVAGATTSYGGSFGMGPTAERADSSMSASEMAKKETKAGLVAEILSDLIEYLQADEKFRQGKYVVMVPKFDPSSRNPLSSNNPGEMQELEVDKLFVKRDE